MKCKKNVCNEYECEEFEEFVNRMGKIEDILEDDYDLKHLQELVEADKENRCIVLPAKIVFELVWDAGKNCDLKCPQVDSEECPCDICSKGELNIYSRKCTEDDLENVGKTVFLTYEAAEVTKNIFKKKG